MAPVDTKTQLLDHAQGLVQARGFNAFSYKDLAQAIGIRTASIHYHFESKALLGCALMERYLEQLGRQLADIDARHPTQRARLGAFIDLYQATERAGSICLCGSFASDLETVPEEISALVQSYLETCEGWVKRRLADGLAAGEFDFEGRPADLATALVSGLQGGLVLARAQPGRGVIGRVRRTFLSSLA